MLRHVSLLSFAVALACLALAAVAEAQEAEQPPPLSCCAGTETNGICDGVLVLALDQNGNCAEDELGNCAPDGVFPDFGAFPHPVLCPAPNTLGVQSCHRWPYRYTIQEGAGNVISVSAISVDSDVDIVAAKGGEPGLEKWLPEGGKVFSPGETDSSVGIGGGVFNMRSVKFAANASVVLGNIYTRTDVSRGTISAVAKFGNVGPLSCAIAGADNVTGVNVGLAPLNQVQADQAGICSVSFRVDARGCPIPGSVTAVSSDPTISCQVNQNVASEINGDPFEGGLCGNRFTSSNPDASPICSFWYCPNAFGGCTEIFYDKGSGECP